MNPSLVNTSLEKCTGSRPRMQLDLDRLAVNDWPRVEILLCLQNIGSFRRGAGWTRKLVSYKSSVFLVEKWILFHLVYFNLQSDCKLHVKNASKVFTRCFQQLAFYWSWIKIHHWKEEVMFYKYQPMGTIFHRPGSSRPRLTKGRSRNWARPARFRCENSKYWPTLNYRISLHIHDINKFYTPLESRKADLSFDILVFIKNTFFASEVLSWKMPFFPLQPPRAADSCSFGYLLLVVRLSEVVKGMSSVHPL